MGARAGGGQGGGGGGQLKGEAKRGGVTGCPCGWGHDRGWQSQASC